MSSQKKKAELLTFGYINQQSDLSIPIAIIKLIQLFYDIYFYWTIKSDQMMKFLNAKNSDCLWSNKTFKIKGITFRLRIHPNGRNSNDIGLVLSSLCIIELPSNIEYVGIYYRVNFETIRCKKHIFHKFTKKQNSLMMMSNFSTLQCLKEIDLNCFVDIKYIKYKSNVNKMDFIKPIKMKNKIKYEWNIKDELIEKCKTFKYGESIISERFGDNNWDLMFFPNGARKENENSAGIVAKFLAFPFGVNYMEIKVKMSVSGDINVDGGECILWLKGKRGNLIHWKNGTFSFSEFKSMQLITIHIELEIIKLMDDNDKNIEKSNWSKYGIIV